MVQKFLEYLELEKKFSPHTITSYRKDLEDFCRFYAESEGSEDLSGANKKVIRNFIVELSSAGLSKRTINRKISSLRSFYLYMLKVGEISAVPMEGISSLKFYPEKQIPFSVDEMADLQEVLEEHGRNLLEKLIVETLYQTGMRKSELCGLKVDDVDLGSLQLKVTGKGNKMRIVPVSEKLAERMGEYLTVRNPQPAVEQYFYVTDKGKKLGEKFVYSVVNYYLSYVTSKKKKSPHILRHSFATHVLENGAEISKVKKVLGHASLASTQVYTNANIEQLKKVFNKAHPRAKK